MANEGTGRRAALAVQPSGKTGTTQNNRDALFIDFAGDLVVGVWVGRDDDKSLGKMTGGTAPARIWRNYMATAVALDNRGGPDLPFRGRRQVAPPRPIQSPIPEEWTEPARAIREIAEAIDQLFSE